MYIIIVLLCALALALGFWFDNEVLSYWQQFWWIPIVFAYLFMGVCTSLSTLSIRWKLLLVIGVALIIGFCIISFDDLLTIYISGAILLIAILGVGYLTNYRVHSFVWLVSVFLGVVLLILPISINRIVITLPNLSGGTTLSLHDSIDQSPSHDANFNNRIDNHFELPIYLGTQIYFQQPHNVPLLQVFIYREDIVLRVSSIRYETRLGYLRMPLFELSKEALMQLKILNKEQHGQLQMDQDYLLIDQIKTDIPVWIQLLHLENHTLTTADYTKVLSIRLLLWLIVCVMLAFWCPRPSEVRK